MSQEAAASTMSGGRRILINAAYRVIADVGGKLASFALYIAMARELGSAGFGVFVFGLAFAEVVTTFANLGQDRILTREVAREHERVHTYFANTVVLKLVLAVPALVISVALLAAFSTSEPALVAALLGLAVVAEQITATCFSTFQAYERLEYVPAALVTQRVLMAGLGIVALVVAEAGVTAVAAIYLGTALVGLAIALFLLFSRIVRPRVRVTPRSWRALMLAALPIGIAGIFSTILFRADMLMLAAFQSAHEVGEYGAAYRLFESTLFLSWGLGSAVYPVFSRLTTASTPRVGFVFERAIKLGVALTLPLAVGAAVLAEPVIQLLYGDQYEASARALALLAPSIALYPIGYFAGYLLVSQDRQKLLLPVYAGVAAENILLNLVLIPAYSLDGAAAGTSISSVLVASLLLGLSIRTVGRLGWIRMLCGPVVAGALSGVAMVLLRNDFAAAVVVGAVVYVASLLLFEWRAYPEDARALRWLLPGRRD